MNLKNVSLEGYNINKVEQGVVDQLTKQGVFSKFSGSHEEHFKHLLDNNLIDDEARVSVMIRVNPGTDWKSAVVVGMKVLVGGTIFGAIINFEALLALLKNPDVLSISWSAPASGVE